MLELVVGLIIILFLSFLLWTELYLFEVAVIKPPRIIEIIGRIELIVVGIVVILVHSYCIGYLFFELVD